MFKAEWLRVGRPLQDYDFGFHFVKHVSKFAISCLLDQFGISYVVALYVLDFVMYIRYCSFSVVGFERP